MMTIIKKDLLLRPLCRDFNQQSLDNAALPRALLISTCVRDFNQSPNNVALPSVLLQSLSARFARIGLTRAMSGGPSF